MYKPCGKADWFTHDSKPAVLKTTTQETMEEGSRLVAKLTTVERKELNFQSYPMNASIFYKPKKTTAMMSSYTRDYAPPIDQYPSPPMGAKDMDADYMLNRKACNVFGLRQSLSSKFMDDHFNYVSENRRKIDLFRQLRNQHHPFV